MDNAIRTLGRLLALFAFATPLFASPQYGDQVDAACMNFNGSMPYAASGCNLCHGSRLSTRMDPAWSYWETNNLTAFCTGTSNQAPNGTITSPASNTTITTGQSISFSASGTDPDNNLPLSYSWTFGGASPDRTQQNPGVIIFNTAGTYVVSLTVTDSVGLADPTPAQRIITVRDVTSCTDSDSDGYSIEGGVCGPIDCNDANAQVNPGAVEICSDNVDNNCNGFIDAADPLATGCSGNANGCTDNDGDNFSPDGGVCGPVDCNDFDSTINPGAREQCGDGIDNDCDQLLDSSDPECNGTDCVGDLLPRPTGTTVARWDSGTRTLLVSGTGANSRSFVLITNPSTNSLLGVARSNTDGAWSLSVPYLNPVPCEVAIGMNGNLTRSAVQNAPANCDQVEPPSPPPQPGNGDDDDDDGRDNGDRDDDDRNNDRERGRDSDDDDERENSRGNRSNRDDDDREQRSSRDSDNGDERRRRERDDDDDDRDKQAIATGSASQQTAGAVDFIWLGLAGTLFVAFRRRRR